MSDGRETDAAGSPPTPEERVRDAVAASSPSCVVHDFLVTKMLAIVDAAVAAELEAVAAHFDDCDRLDPSEWFPPASVAEYVRGRVAAIRARGEASP